MNSFRKREVEPSAQTIRLNVLKDKEQPFWENLSSTSNMILRRVDLEHYGTAI